LKSQLFAVALGFVAGLASPVFAQTAITLAVPEEPPTLDTCQLVGTGQARILALNVFEALTERVSGDSNVQPALATSWKRTSPTTWEFKLRDGVKFHDGEVMDANAVVASINRMFIKKLNCSAASLIFANLQITPEAIDKTTVKITTGTPDPLTPLRLSFFGIASPKTSTEATTNEPVGTGPYRFVRWNRGSSVELQRNENYWGSKPVITKATYLFRGDDIVRSGMVETNEADMAVDLPPEYAKGKGAVSFPIPVTIALRLDTASEPMKDIRMRQALSYAIDRQGLIDALWGGQGVLATQSISPDVLGYNPKIAPTPYNPDLAKKLIAQAAADGVKVNTPIRMFNRVELFPNSQLFAEAIAQQAAAVGIKLIVENREAAAWIEVLRSPSSPDKSQILVDPHQNLIGDASQSVNARFHSSQPRNRIPAAEQKTVDDMITKAGAAEGAEREKLYQDLMAYVADKIVPDVYVAGLETTMIIGPKFKYTPNAQSRTIIRLASITPAK
jgi:peptide/nickel transport system substrate-binding protein